MLSSSHTGPLVDVLFLLFLFLQPFAPYPGDRQINSFSHVFGGGYPAGYYRWVPAACRSTALKQPSHSTTALLCHCKLQLPGRWQLHT